MLKAMISAICVVLAVFPLPARAVSVVPIVTLMETFVFDDLISFEINNAGKLSPDPDGSFVFLPDSGGMLYIERPKFDGIPEEITRENYYQTLQAWISDLTSTYQISFIPVRESIIGNTGRILHTQDFSVSLTDNYDIASEGYLITTPKGAVVVWFSSFYDSRIQDSFMYDFLSSVSLFDTSAPIFSSDLIDDLLSAKKLHYIYWECEDIPYKQIARKPYDYEGKYARFTGKVIQVVESGLDTILRVKLNEEYQSTDDVLYVEYRRSDMRDSRILDDDKIALYGVLDGLETYSTVLNSQASIPRMIAYTIELLDD